MNYKIEVMPKAIKELKTIPRKEAEKIVDKIKTLSNNLSGDVKKLTNFTPEYRLRVGNWRVLFEVEGERIVIYRVLHRKKSYK
jgi:mRNA interferase RelE/StbE